MLVDFARSEGKLDDPSIRQDLMRLHTLNQIGSFNGQRTKAMREAGLDIPGMANISKLLMSDTVRLTRDLGMQILGASGTLQRLHRRAAHVTERRDGQSDARDGHRHCAVRPGAADLRRY